ncbi:hypothetical protein GGI26_002399 [Coemansia sp. RSA 1358]|nr:hypothetical protein GGI26_002399 [Coemansia sp. RSA 1358]
MSACGEQEAYLVQDDILVRFHGYKRSVPGNVLYWALVVCTGGILHVVNSWFNFINIWFTLKRTSIDKADYIHVLDDRNKYLDVVVVRVKRIEGDLFSTSFLSQSESNEKEGIGFSMLRFFIFRHYRFVYRLDAEKFVPISEWKDPNWSHSLSSVFPGLSDNTVEQRKKLFGQCIIDIQEKSYLRLLYEEIVNPFYIFQIASIIIWCFEQYYYYACAIFAISAISIGATLISTKRTMRKIREMAMHTCPVTVLRQGIWTEVQSSELVPGDIFDLGSPNFSTLPCDAVLFGGDCIVNESMLTGESTPESKYPLGLDSDLLRNIDMAAHTFKPSVSRHIIFAGTELVRVRKTKSMYGLLNNSADGHANMRAMAMVLRTGFSSTKGSLVRSILFPRSTKFQFYRDAFRFVGVLAFIAVIGFTANTINLHRLGVSVSAIAKKALDLITVIVPPALPASMSIGMSFAAKRLRKQGIFCISPSRINVASKVAVMCFDKTGTLTEDGLDLLGVHVANQSTGAFAQMYSGSKEITSSVKKAQDGNIIDCVGKTGITVINALATCHSLRLVNNTPIGDPLEVRMLEFSGWEMEEVSGSLEIVVRPPPGAELSLENSSDVFNDKINHKMHISGGAALLATGCLNSIRILKTFDFAPELRRASVLVQQQGAHNNIEAYVKGAPEVIRTLCRPLTIPSDYTRILEEYTQQGYRVIGLAGKHMSHMPAGTTDEMLVRGSVESDLVFMGFLVFENRLKQTTAPILNELRQAKVRVIMCTGDNPLTAVNVARECSLIQQDVHVFVPEVLETECLGLDKQPAANLDSNKHGDANNSFELGQRLPTFNIIWKESTGKQIMLDSEAMVPVAKDYTDTEAASLAEELSRSGRYCIAVTGDAFGLFMKHGLGSTAIWKHILMRGLVYARMSPEQKAALVEQLQELGYITGFCGDGANDCTALKTADIGISLSEAEASVAAPFTSRITDISCVTRVLKEGRCSISTSFACFKYMALYSMIQFTSCCLLYIYNVNLTDGQFLYVDLFTILPITMCMNQTKPFRTLVPKRPSASLISKKVLTSLIGNILLIVGFQVAVYFITEAQSWYHRPEPADPGDPDSTPLQGDINTSIYLFSSFQYLFTGIVFSIGPPYRQAAISNYIYVAVVIVLLLFDLWVLLVPEWWQQILYYAMLVNALCSHGLHPD